MKKGGCLKPGEKGHPGGKCGYLQARAGMEVRTPGAQVGQRWEGQPTHVYLGQGKPVVSVAKSACVIP